MTRCLSILILVLNKTFGLNPPGYWVSHHLIIRLPYPRDR